MPYKNVYLASNIQYIAVLGARAIRHGNFKANSTAIEALLASNKDVYGYDG